MALAERKTVCSPDQKPGPDANGEYWFRGKRVCDEPDCCYESSWGYVQKDGVYRHTCPWHFEDYKSFGGQV